MTALFDPGFIQDGPALEAMRSLGIVSGPLHPHDLSPAKVAMAKATHLLRLFVDSLVQCTFVSRTINQQAEIVRAVTGWDYTVHEAMRVGERVATMGRAFNLREGLTAADDWLTQALPLSHA